MYTQVYSQFSTLITTKQHGFVEGRSTLTNLINFTSDVIESFKLYKQIDVVYTDFSKAFDKVDLSILLIKLKNIGIDEILLNWFWSYLYGRIQKVLFNGLTSEAYRSSSGVPQGSKLGPLLFIIYVSMIYLILYITLST